MDDYNFIFWVYGLFLFAALIMALIWGMVAKSINEKKGYEGGFALGFFFGLLGILIVSLREKRSPENESAKIADSLLSYKKLLDAGAITEREFEIQKIKLLGSDYESHYTPPERETSASKNDRADKELAVYETLYQSGRMSAEDFAKKKRELARKRRR